MHATRAVAAVESLLDEIDERVRAGDLQDARARLEELLKRGMAREFLGRAAGLLRRTGLTLEALKLLNKIVRPSGRVSVPRATALETVEYAAVLIALGASQEGRKVLEDLGVDKHPTAPLFLAFACISEWDYAGAIAPLERYVEDPTILPYQRLVGQVNLAAALVREERLEQAHALLSRLRADTQKFPQLHANVLELSALHAMHEGASERAREALDEAARGIADPTSPSGMLIAKWQAILELQSLEASRREPAARRVRELRTQAKKAKLWEFVRDCDYHLGLWEPSVELLEHVHAGTPFQTYRKALTERVRSRFPHERFPSDRYLWRIGAGSAKPRKLSVLTGETDLGQQLKPGQIPHRLLESLSSDFYRPMNVATLHSRMFPDRHFNPVTSFDTVGKAIARLRAWFEETRFPLKIDVDEGFYRLRASRPCVLEIVVMHASVSSDSRTESWTERLRERFGDGPFSTSDAAAALGLSERSARRALTELTSKSLLDVSGAGKRTRYRVPS